MVKLCIFVGTTLGGMALGFLADALGFSFVWSFVLSGVGSIAGVIIGWKIGQHFK
jgi:predicted branched-subunit amino acid permease